MTSPANKRPRVGSSTAKEPSSTILEPITPSILQNGEQIAELYQKATPYPHAVIDNFCIDGFLENILTELKHNSKVKFKETDLFRVYQSIDLGNLKDGSELAANMPNLMKLKNAIYSPQYRAFIENIAGLEAGSLTDEVDCAANCHTRGCHLLCHDDVIGTRKVSYIIYLTDATPEWTDSDGGRLELYEAIAEEDRFVPGALPVKTVLPAFNSMAYFVVEPGVSFHSVQEVFCDRPRLSIQGWYHTKEAPSQIENATLQRLKSTGKGENTEGSFQPIADETTSATAETNENETGAEPTFSSEDSKFLGEYINKAYLTEESLNEIRTRFEEESSVKLRHFLNDEWSSKIKVAFRRQDEKDKVGVNNPSLDYHVGINEKWKAVGPAHKQRFLQYQEGSVSALSAKKASTDDDVDVGEYLDHLKQNLFQSVEFGRWVGWLSSLGFPLGYRGRIRRFRPGLDYTVAHYGILTTNAVLDTTLCFCGGEGNQCSFDEETNELIGSDDDAIWESGDVGGFECYIEADDDDEGAEAEYDEEDDTQLLSVSASFNTLSLVYRDPGTMKFVKYVGSGAPSSRWDIALEYDVKTDDDDEHQLPLATTDEES